MRWRTAIFGVVGLALLAATVAWGLARWLSRGEGGAQWLVGRIVERAGPGLSIGSVTGTLAEGVTLANLRLDAGDAEILVDRLTIRPGPTDLVSILSRRIVFEDVAAVSVIYLQRDSAGRRTGDPPAGRSLALPIAIELQRVAIESIRVTTPTFESSFEPTFFAGALEGATVRISDFSSATRGISLSGDAEIDMAGPLEGLAEIAWATSIDGVAWSGTGRATGTPSSVAFEHRLDAPFAATADGEIDLGDQLQARVTIEWADLSWPGQELASSPAGTIMLDGWIDSFDFSGSGRIVVQDREVDFTATGTASPDAVSFDDLDLRTALGSVWLSGMAALPDRRVDFEFDARELDPGEFLPEWPALVNARGRLQGSLEPQPSWSLQDVTLDGSVRGESLTASGGVESPAPGQWQVHAVEIDWGGNRAIVDGAVGERLDLDLRLDAPRLEAFGAGIGGEATLDGVVTGTPGLPAFSGTLEAASLVAGDYALERLHVEGTVAATQDAAVDVTFAAEGLRREQVLAIALTGRVEGTTAFHELGVELDHPIGTGAIRASGSWTGTQWAGELGSIEVNQDLLGIWSLEQPAGMVVTPESLVIDTSCLRNAAARFCLSAGIGTANESLAVSIESFDMSSLQPLLGEGIFVSGLYDGVLELSGLRERPTGRLSVSGRSTSISISDVEAPLEIPLDAIEIEAQLTETELRIFAELRAPAGARVELDGVVTEIWTPDPRIDARIDGSWTDLEFISVLSPEVGDVSGIATVAVEIQGSVDSPQARGEARWTNGRIEVPRWGLVVRDLEAVVSSPTGDELVYSVNGLAGDGPVRLTGQTELDPAAGWPTTFRVRGENLAAIQLPEAQIVLSPDLEVVTEWPTVFVAGTVTVPSADLSLDQVAAQSGSVSPDVVVHGVDAIAPQRPLDVRANLDLVLGDDVRFSGSGLDALLSGDLNIDYRSGQDAIGTGTVTLAGSYTTMGQTLELDQGRLLFAGPVTDPRLDVRGIRRFETLDGEVLVGVLVSGTVRQPVTSLFSEPSMSDGDIVSYLVIGRPISDSSRENSEALQTAALSLGLTQALPQIQHFGEAIGLDELGIRTSEANTGELMAGKQLSARLYMRYTYGLINRTGGLLLRFKVSERLRLETRTGDFKAMDLLFTTERE